MQVIKIKLKIILTIISTALVVSCSQYKQHFGGKSGDYVKATTVKPLQYPKEIVSLPRSHRYDIPEINPASIKAIEIAPPDYQD